MPSHRPVFRGGLDISNSALRVKVIFLHPVGDVMPAYASLLRAFPGRFFVRPREGPRVPPLGRREVVCSTAGVIFFSRTPYLSERGGGIPRVPARPFRVTHVLLAFSLLLHGFL